MITIKMARAKTNLSQLEMADKLLVAPNTYVAYEKHKHIMRVDTAIKFCEVTKTNITDINWNSDEV